MKLPDILDMWDKDCEIDDNELSASSVASAKLHAKYLRLLIDAKSKKTKYNNEYLILRKIKFKYYRGELTRQELIAQGWEPYQFNKPLKTEMDEILKSDADLAAIQLKIDYLDTVIYAVESIMNQIKARDWQIKNSLEFKKFLAGS